MKAPTPITITTKAWRPVGTARPGDAGLNTVAGARGLVYSDLNLEGNNFVLVGLATVTLHPYPEKQPTDLPTTEEGKANEPQN